MADFIEVFEGMIPATICEELIAVFDSSSEVQPSLVVAGSGADTQSAERVSSVLPLTRETSHELFDTVTKAFQLAYTEYVNRYPVLKSREMILAEAMNLIRYPPDSGHYVWHCDASGAGTRFRYVSQIAYLNSIADGGETEFRAQGTKVKPVAGSILVFPSGWTHEHRGLPTPGSAKYIITSWLRYPSA